MRMIDTISADDARVLLLDRQGLLDDPSRRAGAASTGRLVQKLGYVQLDSINVVGRAHDLTLAARLDGYEPQHLSGLLEKKRSLFEHWTHDAAALPADFLPQWRARFDQWERYYAAHPGRGKRMGPDPAGVVRSVLRRIRREGPLMSRDFEQERHMSAPKRPGFWNWGFQKAALEYLWRTGRLVIGERRNFQKVYDLRERVFPDVRLPKVSDAKHLHWACEEALARMGAGTPAEIGAFFGGHRSPAVGAWCRSAAKRGRIEAVSLAAADGSKATPGFALLDWRERVAKAAAAPDRTRLLCPFDPVMRDRTRLKRLFDFGYRIEVFVPPAKRKYGYYVLPILEGGRLVGRLDPKFHRDEDRLEIKGLWWETGVKPTAKRTRELAKAIERTARLIGAGKIDAPGL